MATENENKLDKLAEIVEAQAKQISQLTNIVEKVVKPQSDAARRNTEGDIVTRLLNVVTQKGFTDDEYKDALIKLNSMKFKLSNRQLAWVSYWGPNNHMDCKKELEDFLISQLNKKDDPYNNKMEMIDTLQTKYPNPHNEVYLAGVISWIRELNEGSVEK